MSNPASIEDVTNRFERPLTSQQELTAATWLDDAWIIMRREVAGVEARLASDPSAPGHLESDEVVMTLANMVIRVLRNPDALRQWGEDTYQQTVDTALSSGQLYLSDYERARLTPVFYGIAANGMYSIQLGR